MALPFAVITFVCFNHFAPIPNGGAYRPTANNEQVIR